MFSTQDMIMILIVALFLFGPSRLPEMARSLGKAMGEFKKAQTDFDYKQQVDKQLQLDKPLDDNDKKIQSLAKDMGIDVQNKTSDQIIEEIRIKMKSNQSLT